MKKIVALILIAIGVLNAITLKEAEKCFENYTKYLESNCKQGSECEKEISSKCLNNNEHNNREDCKLFNEKLFPSANSPSQQSNEIITPQLFKEDFESKYTLSNKDDKNKINSYFTEYENLFKEYSQNKTDPTKQQSLQNHIKKFEEVQASVQDRLQIAEKVANAKLSCDQQCHDVLANVTAKKAYADILNCFGKTTIPIKTPSKTGEESQLSLHMMFYLFNLIVFLVLLI